MTRLRIVSVVGTRPQLIKAAALQPIVRERHDELFVDTGQHWDERMAGGFFGELGLARPDHTLAAGGGTHAEQTAAMLTGLEPVLRDAAPDAVVVFGDTNSTLAATLTAAKLGIPIAHVEAGLRSFDRRMPEELNRVVVDHLSRWRLAPTAAAMANLTSEGLTDGAILVGDVLQDLVARVAPSVRRPEDLREVASGLADASDGDGGPGPDRRVGALASGEYLFATIHRQENREAAAVAAWTTLLRRLARPARPVVLALHPGTAETLARLGIDLGPDVLVIRPQGYRSSLALQLHAAAVLTDSGGVQREAAWLRVPCLVLRATTEWLEAVAESDGRMAVVGLDADRAAELLDRLAPPGSAAALDRAAHATPAPAGAAERIVAALEADLSSAGASRAGR